MGRLIDADALDKDMSLRAANDRDNARRTWARAICAVHDAPTIDPVRHGRYIEAKVGGMGIYPDGQVMCSECKTIMPSTWRVYPPYCFGCGAKMEDEYDNGD